MTATGRLRALVVLGPTGSGKSALAMAVAQHLPLPVELVSVDSAQVYRGMDIGTAKPSAAEQAALPHHLIDLRDPEQAYSAGEFRRDCLAAIAEICGRGAMPLLVGGTMLYFRALFHGIANLPQADAALRASLDARAVRAGWPALHAELAQLDPLSAARIHANDAQRIQRALEVQALAGRPLSQLWQDAAQDQPDIDWAVAALEPGDRAVLHAQLAGRFDAMLAAGLVQEVHDLLRRPGLHADSPALRAVGYRQLLGHCLGQLTLAEAREQAIAATRQLAKRQLTWLRSGSVATPGLAPLKFDPQDPKTMERFRDATLQWLEGGAFSGP
jgi:tRNA dimethylallyltransferase